MKWIIDECQRDSSSVLLWVPTLQHRRIETTYYELLRPITTYFRVWDAVETTSRSIQNVEKGSLSTHANPRHPLCKQGYNTVLDTFSGEREQNYPKASGESEVMPGLRKAYLGTMCFMAMARLFVLKAMLKQGIWTPSAPWLKMHNSVVIVIRILKRR